MAIKLCIWTLCYKNEIVQEIFYLAISIIVHLFDCGKATFWSYTFFI